MIKLKALQKEVLIIANVLKQPYFLEGIASSFFVRRAMAVLSANHIQHREIKGFSNTTERLP